MPLRLEDDHRVRTLTLDRPDALNAFDERLCDDTTDALIAAADDPAIAVVVLTGAGRAFSAGVDLTELGRRTEPDFTPGRHGFSGLLRTLLDFPKPLVCAVNGVGIGIGATLLGFADIVVMASTARLRYPFTALGVAPEAASSLLLARTVGHQEAAWLLLSSEWVDAETARRTGIARTVCAPEDVLPTALDQARTLAAQPIASLVAVKRTMLAPIREAVLEAFATEAEAFSSLLGGPANRAALTAFAAGGQPDFVALGL